MVCLVKGAVMVETALKVVNLSLNYDATQVLWDITLDVPKAVLAAIIGPNGAGKSSFIKAILGLNKNFTGKVSLLGQSLPNIRQKVAYVPQRESVDWTFPITVQELVLMGCYGRVGLGMRPSRSERDLALHCLEKVGMHEFAHRQISQLSGGQQQRIFIARALMQQADIYFMDEPFAGIDMASESSIMTLLHELKKEQKTVFIVHHDLNTIEKYFDWVILLNMRLISSGPTSHAFNAENLAKTYGKNYWLLEDALKRSNEKNSGETA